MKYYILKKEDLLPGGKPGKWVQQESYPRRKGWVVVDIMRDGESHPHPDDAQAWDDLRLRRGCPSR
jgi:hypothetical protein